MSKQTMFYMKKCAPIFSMLQDERRQEITQLLFENRELSVTALTEKLSLSGSFPSSEAAAGYGTGNGPPGGERKILPDEFKACPYVSEKSDRFY